MTLLACGMSHQSAPAAIRERWVIAPDQYAYHLRQLISHPAITEAAVLSTCNRTEVYCYAQDPLEAVSYLKTRYMEQNPLLLPHWYVHQQDDALRHLMRVASGLDSMVLGEPQIFGQVKQAYQIAKEEGTLGRRLTSLFQRVFNASKAVRSQTDISQAPVSIAYTGVCLIKQVFESLSNATVLLVGSGETIQLAAKHLETAGVKQFYVASRRNERAELLASSLGGAAITISQIEDILPETDIVISATRSQLPLLGKGLFERIQKRRRHKAMVILDLAMPRDVEPEVGSLDDIYLYNLDHLQSLIDQNHLHREKAATVAEELINSFVNKIQVEVEHRSFDPEIKEFREIFLNQSDQELQLALNKLATGSEPELVLRQFAHRITQKALDYPTRLLKNRVK